MTDAAGLARAYLAAHNDHDAERLVELYWPQGSHHEMATGSVREGGAAIGSGLARLLAAFPDAHWAGEGALVDGPRAAIPYVLTGTLRQPLGPFPPRGQPLNLPGLLLLDFDDTGIARSRDYWDAQTFERQMRPAEAPAPTHR